MDSKQNGKPPATVDDLFPSRWLRADDLRGKSYTLTIVRVTVEQVRSNFTHSMEWKAALYFDGAQKGMVLNKTQARIIEEIAGTNVIESWVGVRITLRPGRAHNDKPTILVSAPAAEVLK